MATSRTIISITFQIAECVTFIALMVLIWRVSKKQRWQIRAVIYGWAASFLLGVFWCFLVPALCRQFGFHLPVEAFPDGTIAVGALAGGWFWPLIIVGISSTLNVEKDELAVS